MRRSVRKQTFIPVCEPVIGAQERRYVEDCLRTGRVSSSAKYIEEFEEAWAAYNGREFGVALSSGTAALEVAFRALELQPGDEVILPVFTVISCVLAVIRCGATPVLVDSDAENWQMDPKQVAEKITERTRAILVVHTYGHPAEMEPLVQLAERNGLCIVEDASEAHGAEYQNLKCGSFGDISVFSFNANKLVTTGEGGMLVTDNPALAERAKSLRNLCSGEKRRFEHKDLGYNFRMTNMQAALGLGQVERLDEIIARKREIAHQYKDELATLTMVKFPIEESWAFSNAWIVAMALSDEASCRAKCVRKQLALNNIDSGPFFTAMHSQTVFRNMGLFAGERYPVAEKLMRRGLYLPNGVTLTKEQIHHICKTLQLILTSEPEITVIDDEQAVSEMR